VDAARPLLLSGMPPAEVAVAVGFHDQAHLTRHFKRHTATTPARFARGGR
jgi:transcriptional regulator GlxA family with amidase domain